MTTDSLLPHALTYAQNHYPVFPVKVDKRPLTRRGFKDASTDAKKIEKWWTQYPGASIGMPTGEASGIVVIDVDHRPDKRIELPADIVTLLNDCPVQVITGGGGAHYYFAHPGVPVKNVVGLNGLDGLDVRGDGGYVVLPPSPHQSGNEYVWTFKTTLPLNLTPLPDFFRDLLAKGPEEEGDYKGPEGLKIVAKTRNVRLHSMGAALRAQGLDYDGLLMVLTHQIGRASCRERV